MQYVIKPLTNFFNPLTTPSLNKGEDAELAKNPVPPQQLPQQSTNFFQPQQPPKLDTNISSEPAFTQGNSNNGYSNNY
jgi:hypothetical protein